MPVSSILAARSRVQLASAFLLLSSLAPHGPQAFFHSCSAHGDPVNLVRPFPAGHSMVLPLFLSSPNSSRQSLDGSHRRHLQKEDRWITPNARMALYDDLLTNGYYTTRLRIGTPPQKFALIVDTGSSVTYVPCSTCEVCGDHQDAKFQPDLSSTYQPVKCHLNCTCDEKNTQCVYERQYAEMSSSSGVLGEDVVSFGDESMLEPQRAVFGCENLETGDLFNQRADGIMGLGRGELSIMDQLVDKGVISDSFSLCYGGMDMGGGAMVLGGISPPGDMVFSHSDPVRSPYYNIELKEIHVAGKPLQLNPRVFDSKYGTVLDSGTTYAYLPEAAFVEFRDSIVEKLHPLRQIHGPDPNYNDICFSGAGSDVSQLPKFFPEVELAFGSGQKLSLAPENYLFRHSKVHGGYCLGIFQNENDQTTLLGGIIVRNTLVTYDRENQRIGFWKTNCSELWDRLHSPGTPSPAPSASYSGNKTIGMSPTWSPSGLPNKIIPGKLQVGLIIFDLFLSLKYPDLVPRVTELEQYIARELEVNTSQVHLLNVTSKGNGSLMTWAILPPGSDDYISGAAATRIILRLTDDRLSLPYTFGSYKLVKWKVEPPLKRTWWQQRFLALVVGAILAIICSFSTFLSWYIWRHRKHPLGTYKPVNAVMPEQELQPL
ncbi:aspartic proteinase 36-like isoform X2 [Magnolia sinica]|uniref:aspartic proteinase 36-like isoform X2 n=1 Tax=Magnolia sinica TaxID=86752 RepID=UPI002658426D|nr:aspartic proteinase 36-like isoform X2 [Magnolia sinica]XP_058069999.1 aspartic proteinase 36-like isoform X2 [Magnolia sinica]